MIVVCSKAHQFVWPCLSERIEALEGGDLFGV